MFEIKFTESEVGNLLEFFELEFISSVKKDEAIDNIDYLVEMCEIYRKLRDCLSEKGGAEG